MFWLARVWAGRAMAAAEDLCLNQINALLPEVSPFEEASYHFMCDVAGIHRWWT